MNRGSFHGKVHIQPILRKHGHGGVVDAYSITRAEMRDSRFIGGLHERRRAGVRPIVEVIAFVAVKGVGSTVRFGSIGKRRAELASAATAVCTSATAGTSAASATAASLRGRRVGNLFGCGIGCVVFESDLIVGRQGAIDAVCGGIVAIGAVFRTVFRGKSV